MPIFLSFLLFLNFLYASPELFSIFFLFSKKTLCSGIEPFSVKKPCKRFSKKLHVHTCAEFCGYTSIFLNIKGTLVDPRTILHRRGLELTIVYIQFRYLYNSNLKHQGITVEFGPYHISASIDT